MNDHRFRKLAMFAVGLSMVFSPALADQPTSESNSYVPARIRALEGDATLVRDREQDRIAVSMNAPVFAGDRLDNDGGPLELQFPNGSLVWLDAGTRLDVLGLQDSAGNPGEGTVLSLREGTVEIEFQGGDEDKSEMRVDTPESSVYIMGRGRFRMESSKGVTTVSSYRGVAELAGDDGSVLVRSGQRSKVEARSTPEEPWAINTLRLDPFGEWCERRSESYISESGSEEGEYLEEVPRPIRHYVSELDSYGNWQYMATYGWVWRPGAVQVGWRPYYSGYWSWYPGGWTWISYEPWGWLPYHYGRWSWVSPAGWVWIPGAVYAGAWVSWSVTPTYVGWCPLDFYNRPAYVSVNYTSATVSRYGGGWNFLPLNRWGDRSVAGEVVRADKVPHLSGAVTTRTLPHFDIRKIRTNPEVVQRVVRETDAGPTASERSTESRSLPFRLADRREAATPRKDAGFPRRSQDTVRPSLAPPFPRAGAPQRVPESFPGRVAPNRRDYRPAEPLRPHRIGADPRSLNGNNRWQARPPLAGRVAPPPRFPSASQDPSRRVLNRILGDAGGASRQIIEPGRQADGTEKDRPRSGVVPSTRPSGAARAEARPSRPRSQRELTPPRKQDDAKKNDKP